jgi:hypothetical protein
MQKKKKKVQLIEKNIIYNLLKYKQGVYNWIMKILKYILNLNKIFYYFITNQKIFIQLICSTIYKKNEEGKANTLGHSVFKIMRCL